MMIVEKDSKFHVGLPVSSCPFLVPKIADSQFVSPSVHTVQIQVMPWIDTSSLDGDPNGSMATATVGHGSVTIEEVKLVNKDANIQLE